MELSRSQLSYLTAIDALKSLGATQTTISNFLDVKRPSVNAALKILMQNDYVCILRKEDKTITYGLTPQGNDVLQKLQREKEILFSHFRDFVGLSEEETEFLYSHLYGAYNESYLEKLEAFQKNGFQKPALRVEKKPRSILTQYQNKTYHVPFRVNKLDGSATSMGNKGFLHPATVILDDKSGNLYLEARMFYYRTDENKLLKGSLSSLYYYCKNEWLETAVRGSRTFVIPLKHIMYQSNEQGEIETGHIKIKAESSNPHMPVSIAEITLIFQMMEPVE